MRTVPWYAGGLAALMCCMMVQAQEVDPAPAKKSSVPAQPQAATPGATTAPQGVSVTQKGRGTLFIKESTWDFGYVAQDAKISHEFIIQNVGDDTLFIERIKPT